MATAEDMARQIIRNPRTAVESAKETILEARGRSLDGQLRLEAVYGYSTMADSEIAERHAEFFEKRDADRATTKTS